LRGWGIGWSDEWDVHASGPPNLLWLTEEECSLYGGSVEEIVFQVEMSDGLLVASWDSPEGGGITTQGKDLRDLQEQVTDAVRCHFDVGTVPRKIRLHFVEDPVLIGQ